MAGISLENRLAIYEQIARYSHAVDNNRGQEWSELFLEDGKLIWGDTIFDGRQALVNKSQDLKDGPTEYRHSITNIYLEDGATNEQAVARAYGLVSDWAEKPAKLNIFAEYCFNFVNTDEGWKIREANVHGPYK